MKNIESVEERFWSHTEPNGLGCLNWTAGLSHGYGQIHIDGHNIRAHRLSYRLFNGKIPAGMCVLHKCDNPRCVAPEHLEVGTNAKNQRQKVERGRSMIGEYHPRVKLTLGQAKAIKDDPRSQRAIAKEYGIAQIHVSRIKSGKSWAKALQQSGMRLR